MRTHRFAAFALVSAPLVTGCSSSSSSAPPGGYDAGQADATYTDLDASALLVDAASPSLFGDVVFPTPPPQVTQNGTFDVDGGVDVPGSCPAQPPAGGAACTAAGARCTYGTSASFSCRSIFTCDGAQWSNATQVGMPPGNHFCDVWDAVCAGAAPGDLPPCATSDSYCHFGDGTLCMCSAAFNQGQWQCAVPTKDPACPPVVPNLGTACTGSARCEYGFVSAFCSHDSALVACVGGVWNGGPASACVD